MRKLGLKSKSKTHLHPMAMCTHAVMPPPPTRQKELGEQRITRFAGVAVSILPEIDEETIFRNLTESDVSARQAAYTDAVYDAICKEHSVLQQLIDSKAGKA